MKQKNERVMDGGGMPKGMNGVPQRRIVYRSGFWGMVDSVHASWDTVVWWANFAYRLWPLWLVLFVLSIPYWGMIASLLNMLNYAVIIFGFIWALRFKVGIFPDETGDDGGQYVASAVDTDYMGYASDDE